MILDDSGIDYSPMLLFVIGFLVYWKKINQILAHPATRGLRLDFKAVTSKLSRKQNLTSQTTIFKVRTIKFKKISSPIFNWKIAAILFVSVIDYY